MLWLCSGTLMSFLCRPHRRRACNWITLWPVTPPHHCPAGCQSIDRHRRTSLLEERRDTYSSWTGGWLGRGEREGCSYSISGVEHWISCIAISIGIIGFFFIVCFTRYFVFSMAVPPRSPGVVYYHLILRLQTRIPGVAPFSFRIGIWDLFVHRGQKSYTPTAFGMWTTPGVIGMKHASS